MIQLEAERTRKLAWCALAIYLVALGISAILRMQGDFAVYYAAGKRVLHGAAIYPPSEKDHFLYAPIFAIVLAPFALLPRHAAQGAFFLVNAWGLVALILGSGMMLFGRSRTLPAALIIVPVLLTSILINNNFEHGQVNLPVLALCVWSIVYARESRTMASGAMLAAAILIKPFALLAGLYLLLRGRFAVLGWTIVAVVALLAAPILVFGPHGLIEQTAAYTQSVMSMTDRYRTMLTNQSAVAWIARLELRAGADPAASTRPLWMGMGFEAVLIALEAQWIWRAVRAEGDEVEHDRSALAGLFCLMPGFAPISWKSYFAALIVPYMLLSAMLLTTPPSGARLRPKAIVYLVISVMLNFVPGRRLGNFALFYSAHFLSSIAAFFAVATGIWRMPQRPAAVAVDGGTNPAAAVR
ncbi:MAG: glycosyltransferase family 87 protein [Candidatus Binataceae bacterium]